MAIVTYPLNLIEYTAENVEHYLSTRSSGVLSVENNFSCEVTGDREVTISPGLAWIKNTTYGGKSVFSDDDTILQVDIADGAFSRIDRVVIRFSKAANASEIVIKKGTPASAAVAPDLSRTEAVYELGLYTITVPAASLTISQSNITDTRLDETVCGLMRDGIKKIPTSELYEQYTTFLTEATQDVSQWQSSAEAEFTTWLDEQSTTWNEWFSGVQDALGEDVAGQLLLMIQGVEADLDTHTSNNEIHVSQSEKTEWTGKAEEKKGEYTLLSASWVGDAAPYTQSISIDWMTDTITAEIWPVLDSETETAITQKAAFGVISRIDSGSGNVTITCLEEKPTIDLPVMIRGLV